MSSLLTDLRRALPILLPRRHGLAPGRLAAARMILLVAVTAVYVGRAPAQVGRAWVAWLGTGVLLVLTAAEPVLERMQPRLQALQLPGFTAARRPAATAALVPVGLLLVVLLALVAVLSGSGPSPWWFVAAAVVQALALAAASAEALRAYAGRGRRSRELRAALESYAPEIVLHTARRGALYQVQMWLPLLDDLGRRYIVLTRDDGALPGLASVTSAPVVARTTWRELDDAVVPSLKVALYVNSVAANADFVTYRQLTHVYLGHGESDKALSHHPAHAMYDRVFVSGQAAVDRYREHGVVIPEQKLVRVGRPQSAAVRRAERPVGEVAAPTVLYAPTWGGYNEHTSHSSLPQAVAIVTALLRRPGAVVFRPHPFSRERPGERGHVAAVEALLAADAARTGRSHRYAETGTFADSANTADAMVADLSSVLTEFLFSDKPMAVVAVGESASAFRERHQIAEAAYVVSADLGNLQSVLDDLLQHDPLRPERERVLRRYGGEAATGDAAAPFKAALTALLDDRRP